MTLATIRSYGKLLNQLVAHAVTDVEQITKRLDSLGATAVKNGLTQTFGHILEPYRQATGLLAARYLSETIVSKYGGQLYIPPGVETIAKGQIAASVNWAITGSSSTDQLIRKLGGTTTRLVLGAARDTTSNNVELLNGTDYFGQTLRIGWQRFPLPGCCDFCAMIASRGPVYKSLESATTVVGRGSNRTGYDSNGVRLSGGIGGGVVARGNKPLGSKYHDSCKCVVAPVYEGDDWANDWAERFMDRFTGKVTREQEAAVAATIAWNSPKAIEIRNSVGKSGNKSSTGGGKSGSGSAGSAGNSGGGGKVPPGKGPFRGGYGPTPDPSDKEGWKKFWKKEQDKLGMDFKGDVISPDEIITLERLKNKQNISWIPRSKTGLPTYDFYWKNIGNIPIEMKSSSASYSKIIARIKDAVKSAQKHEFIKENFLIDIGESKLYPGLQNQLEQINQRSQTVKLKRLFILSENGEKITEINLQ